jgi:hypothetical protein
MHISIIHGAGFYLLFLENQMKAGLKHMLIYNNISQYISIVSSLLITPLFVQTKVSL